jgi:PAS domain S-box-containing protein
MSHQLLIKNLKNPVVILDVDEGRFIDCNDLALDFFQLSKKEILSKNPFDLSPPNVYGHEAEAYSRQVIQEALAGGNPVFDWIHIDKEGHEIPCEIRLIRFPPFNKQLVRGTIIDKRKETNLDLRETEERLRLSMEASQIGIFDFYPQANKVTWNDRLFEIFELDPTNEIDLNKHFFSIIHPDDKEQVTQEFEGALNPKGPDTRSNEYRVIVSGKTKHVLAYSRLIRNDDGEVIRMLGTTQEITALRESEKRLRENEELLDSIFRTKRK